MAEESIQLHGGIGMTWELPLAHYAKRLVMIDHQLGDEDHHLRRYIALGRQRDQRIMTAGTARHAAQEPPLAALRRALPGARHRRRATLAARPRPNADGAKHPAEIFRNSAPPLATGRP